MHGNIAQISLGLERKEFLSSPVMDWRQLRMSHRGRRVFSLLFRDEEALTKSPSVPRAPRGMHAEIFLRIVTGRNGHATNISRRRMTVSR